MSRRLYTIGHSNQALEEFLSTLSRAEIEVLVDVRSWPRSRFVPHFNRENLEKSLGSGGYLYMGKELGGRPDSEDLYEASGRVDYRGLSRTPTCEQALERLERGMDGYRVCVMCSEEDPADCHRRLLVVRSLLERDPLLDVVHLRRKGEDHSEDREELAERDWLSVKPVRSA